MAKLLTISDPAEDAALIAARAYHQSDMAGGYSNYVAEGLHNAGMSHLVANQGGNLVTVDRDGLMAIFAKALDDNAQTKAIRIAGDGTGDGDAYSAAEGAYSVFANLGLRDKIYAALRDGSLTFTVDTTAPTFDPAALLRKYGKVNALPTPEGEHAEAIEAQRKAMTAAFLAVADAHGLCSVFDACLTTAGLGGYAPAREAEVTAEVEGIGTVTVTVPLTRAGKVSQRDLGAYMRDRIARIWQERAIAAVKDGKVTGLPEGALV